MSAHRLGYRASLDWLLDNDDCEWLLDADPTESVSAALVADIFGVSTGKVTRDLLRRQAARIDLRGGGSA